MATGVVVEDREKLLSKDDFGEESFEGVDNSFDGAYKDLQGRATADYLPLEKDEILLRKGWALV